MPDQPAKPPLADDCFALPDERITHDAAIAALKARVTPIAGSERVDLERAAGRLAATAVSAPHAVPQHRNAAVDGYAYAHAVVAEAARAAGGTGPVGVPVLGRAAAGHPFPGRVEGRGAVRIFTGAVVPEGADTVLMQEDARLVEASDGRVEVAIPAGQKPGANVRRAGEDLAAGSSIIARGERLRPQDLAALASVGLREVEVFKRLKVAIVASGDEITSGGALAPGQVHDANTPMLKALVAASGAEATALGVWRDTLSAVREGLSEAARHYDVIITTGGASRGDEDHMAAAAGELGRRHFWQIAVKPGRPMLFAQVAGTPMIGLPGNPVAVFVCYLMYVHPLLCRLSGADWPEPTRLRLPAAFAFKGRKPGRREYWRGRLVGTGAEARVEKFERDGSGLISGLRFADGLIEIPEDHGDVALGEPVTFIPFAQFGIR